MEKADAVRCDSVFSIVYRRRFIEESKILSSLIAEIKGEGYPANIADWDVSWTDSVEHVESD